MSALRTASAGLLLAVSTTAAAASGGARRIPVFARQYRTTCTTCHVVPPKLNGLGEAFRINGYRFPRTSRLIRQEPSVPLGDDEWKTLWPRAIWPGEIPGTPGVSLRIQSDVEVRRASPGAYSWTYRFPSDLYILGAATLGDGLAAFVESEWSPDVGFRVLQAKVTLQDPIGALPPHVLGVWVGLQGLYPTMFADRQLDRATRQLFRWQTFAVSDIRVSGAAGGEVVRSANDFRLVSSVPTVELEGVAHGRLGYGLGLSQGMSQGGTDRNNHKDPYLRLRYKLGGLRLDGEESGSVFSARAYAGQLRDRTLTIEGFAYRGAERVAAGRTDRYWRFGGAVRAIAGPWDVGLGAMVADHHEPWGTGLGARFSSWYAKGEWTALPWLVASLKGERAALAMDGGAAAPVVVDGAPARLLAMPGVVLLMRPNVRLVMEGELVLRPATARPNGLRRQHALWFRSDLSF